MVWLFVEDEDEEIESPRDTIIMGDNGDRQSLFN